MHSRKYRGMARQKERGMLAQRGASVRQERRIRTCEGMTSETAGARRRSRVSA